MPSTIKFSIPKIKSKTTYELTFSIGFVATMLISETYLNTSVVNIDVIHFGEKYEVTEPRARQRARSPISATP